MFSNWFFYTLLPILLPTSFLFVFFHVPDEMILDVFYLPFVFCLISVFFFLIHPKSNIKRVSESFFRTERFTLYSRFSFVFCIFTLALVPLDIYYNGFKLTNPLSYAEFHGLGRYVRHITNFSWFITLFSCVFYRRSHFYKLLLIFSLVMPILFVDRNRLLFCFFVLLFCWYFSTESKNKNKKIAFFVFIILALFSFLGSMRSGDSFSVASSGASLVSGYFPLRDSYEVLPVAIQQVILYIITPVFNFAHMSFLNFSSEVFWLKQVALSNRDAFPKWPYAPVLVTRFNVGTEFFPILLAYGKVGVFFSVLFILSCFSFFYNLFISKPGFFTLLLFLKIAYVVLLLGFAPQFYIYYNFFSFLLVLFLVFFAKLFFVVFRPFLKHKESF